MSKMAKEFAEKYLKEELDSRLKHLGGQPDALCQAYQTALDAMAPKKKCYVFTVETRDAQAYLEPACIPPSDEDEWEGSDVEELDEEDIWSDVSGNLIYDKIYADSKEEAVQAFIKKCPQHDIDSFNIETYIAPDDDNTRSKNKAAAKFLKEEMKHQLEAQDIVKETHNFLDNEKIGFGTLIRAFNFFSDLTPEERDIVIEAYKNDKFNNHGWY